MLLIPSLLPRQTQRDLLSQLMHECLADPSHKTNVHAHHQLPYYAINSKCGPELIDSFFNLSPKSSELFVPLDSGSHSPITVSQFLHKKLRWLTLGGQYDWNKKIYPKENHPKFPAKIGELTQRLFPEMRPEAAIVNVYAPGDTLSIHRDVSEDSDEGLVSLSIGCDGVFVIGLENESGRNPYLVVRLQSGDAVYMSGPARFAWHGVPKIMPNTCPEWLSSWPANSKEEKSTVEFYDNWRGWISKKRVNLNIRQMNN